jgi:hypothetical protein
MAANHAGVVRTRCSIGSPSARRIQIWLAVLLVQVDVYVPPDYDGPGVEDDAFAAVCRQLRPELAALASVARITGWRKSELRSRQCRHVDFTAGWLRLEPEETKNREGRMFPLIPELRAVLETQRARVEAIQKETSASSRGCSAGRTGHRWATSRSLGDGVRQGGLLRCPGARWGGQAQGVAGRDARGREEADQDGARLPPDVGPGT